MRWGRGEKKIQRKKRGHKQGISVTELVPAKKSARKKRGVEGTKINLLNSPS